MSNALADQIEHARTLIAALTPATEPEIEFTEADGTLPVGKEPPAGHRVFDVHHDGGARLTTEWFATGFRNVRGRFVVEINYDARRAFKSMDRVLVEDTDQITSLLESPDSRASTEVLQIRLADQSASARDESGEFVTVQMVFEVDYRVAL